MINIEKIQVIACTLMIEGNDREELMSVHTMGRQMLVVTCSAGGHQPHILHYGELTMENLRRLIIKWASDGIKPTTKEIAVIRARALKAVRQFMHG